MVRREVYEAVGGLDESFAVAFNDVDFCVRVRKAGYQNLFTPFAMLYHYESKSRGLDEAPRKAGPLRLGGDPLPDPLEGGAGRGRPLPEPQLRYRPGRFPHQAEAPGLIA